VRLGEVVLIDAYVQDAGVGGVALDGRRPAGLGHEEDRVGGIEGPRGIGEVRTVERQCVTGRVVGRGRGQRPRALQHLDGGFGGKAGAVDVDRLLIGQAGVRRDRGSWTGGERRLQVSGYADSEGGGDQHPAASGLQARAEP
jgi:hypothetical protein